MSRGTPRARFHDRSAVGTALALDESGNNRRPPNGIDANHQAMMFRGLPWQYRPRQIPLPRVGKLPVLPIVPALPEQYQPPLVNEPQLEDEPQAEIPMEAPPEQEFYGDEQAP